MKTEPDTALYSGQHLPKIHRTLGHASLGRMENFLNKTITTKDKEDFECLNCNKAKIKKSSFPQVHQAASRVLNRIHVDLMGPLNPTAKGGFRFILNLINSFSGYLACFPLKTKDEACETLIFLIENEHRKH